VTCDERITSSGRLTVQLLTPAQEALPPQAEFALAQRAVENAQQFILRATEFVRRILRESPERCGLTQNEANTLLELPTDEFPLDEPSFIVHSSNTWNIHFQEGRLPICAPYGLIVYFEGSEPVQLEDISEAESL
jgi:hypothetical protein